MNSKRILPIAERWLWLALLGGLFCGVYGLCNWITALRRDVGELYFAWERHIPFVPVMIIPYMSIDLLFAGAIFLCRSREELHTLAARITLAIGLSAIGFLLFPLRMGFARPEVDGLLGAIFAPLNAMDLPFNLAPSLHISLRTIIWTIYGRRLSGWFRKVTGLWFVLIGASTLLVYQHHLFDVLAGEVVALVCLYLLPERQLSTNPDAQQATGGNCKLANVYVLIGIIFLGTAATPFYGAWLMVWPAIAVLIVASGYHFGRVSIFRKSNGQISLDAKTMLAPFLLASDWSRRWFARNQEAWVAVTPNVLVGRKLSRREVPALLDEGVTAALDLTAEYDEAPALRKLAYLNIQLLDHTAPSLAQLEQGVAFIRRHILDGKVYVHCALGYSRSVAMVAAYLMAEEICTSAEDAARFVEAKRTCARITPRLTEALMAFQLARVDTTNFFPGEAGC